MYHIGKRLSIWLRHEFLRGGHKPQVDGGGWVPIDDIINENRFWESVYFEMKKNGFEHRATPDARICYHSKDMAGQKPPDVDELMHNRTCWAITLAIINKLWNWGRRKKRMEFVGAKLNAAVRKMFCKKPNVHDVSLAKGQANGLASSPRCALQLWSLKQRSRLGAHHDSNHGEGDGRRWWRMAHDCAKLPQLDCQIWAIAWGLRHRRQDVHFSPFPPWNPRYNFTFTSRFANDTERGIAIYVPIRPNQHIDRLWSEAGDK